MAILSRPNKLYLVFLSHYYSYECVLYGKLAVSNTIETKPRSIHPNVEKRLDKRSDRGEFLCLITNESLDIIYDE